MARECWETQYCEHTVTTSIKVDYISHLTCMVCSNGLHIVCRTLCSPSVVSSGLWQLWLFGEHRVKNASVCRYHQWDPEDGSVWNQSRKSVIIFMLLLSLSHQNLWLVTPASSHQHLFKTPHLHVKAALMLSWCLLINIRHNFNGKNSMGKNILCFILLSAKGSCNWAWLFPVFNKLLYIHMPTHLELCTPSSCL